MAFQIGRKRVFSRRNEPLVNLRERVSYRPYSVKDVSAQHVARIGPFSQFNGIF